MNEAKTIMNNKEKQLTVDIPNVFELLIPLESYKKIMAYVDICDTEVTGFADVEYNPETYQFVIGEVHLVEQEAGAGHVLMDEDIMAKFNVEMIQKGATQLPQLWWHSHVNFQASFSSIDEGTSLQLQNDTFNISLVVNKKRGMYAKMYLPILLPLVGDQLFHVEIDPLPVKVQTLYDVIPQELVDEVKEKVTVKVQTTTSYPGYQYNTAGKYSYSPTTHAPTSKASKAKTLPKVPSDAATKVEKLGLIKNFDTDLNEDVYTDPDNGDIWIDYWGALENDEVLQKRLDNIQREIEEAQG